mgnify:FL=1
MSGAARQWGDGPREVLALHCSLAHSGAWEGVARLLGPGHHITAPDILGHGKAPDIDPARDLHDQCYDAILPDLPEGRFDAIGHSFGATLALRLAEDMPDRIRSLTLIEPVIFAAAKGSGAFSGYMEQMMEYADANSRDDREAETRAFLDVWGNGADFEDIPPAQKTYAMDRIRFIKASEPALFADNANMVPRLSNISAPVLLVEGNESPPIIRAILDRMEQDIPDSSRISVPGAGHMVPISHPRQVAEAVLHHFGALSDAV